MASPPRRPIERKTNAPRDAVADRAIIPKQADPRQAGLFDAPLPKWIRPCLPTLVDKPPVGPQWVHQDQMGRLPRLCLHRRRQGDGPHPQRARLDVARPGDRSRR